MTSHLPMQAELARDLDSVLSASNAFYSHGGEFQTQEQHDAVVGVKRDAFLAKWGPFVVVSSLELRKAESDDVDGDLPHDARCDRRHAATTIPTAELEQLAQQAGMETALFCGGASCVWTEGCQGVSQANLERFAELVTARALAAPAAQAATAECGRGSYRLLR